MKRSYISMICAGSGVAALCVPAAAAQNYYERNRYEAVTERNQPEFDPEPLRVGAFLVDSQLEAGVISNDNVLASDANEESDVILRLAPRANLRSDWSRHELGAGLDVEHQEYSELDDETATNLRANVNGRLDITRESSLAGRVFVQDLVENRTAVSSSRAFRDRIEFDVLGGQVEGRFQRDRMQAIATLQVAEYDYQDGQNFDGTPFDQDFRDQTQSTLRGRLSYAVSPDVAVFGQAEANTRDYDTQTFLDDGTPVSRDTDGYAIQAGVNFELPVLLRGDVAVGYLEETPDDEQNFRELSGLSVDGRLEWFPTRLTTVTATGSRRAEDPGLADVANAVRTSANLRVDHELRRNIILFASAGLTSLELEEDDRDDDITDFGVGGIYKLNKRAHLEAFYRLFNRESTLAEEFDQNVVGVTLRVFP